MEEEKPKYPYNPVKDYLEHSLEDKEVYLWEEEIEKIIHLARRMDGYYANVGIRPERIEHNLREKSFHDCWMKENLPCPGLNYGHGLLQDLFIERKGTMQTPSKTVVINHHDRMIAATVIQWLGSNCGMAFLSDALDGFGYVMKPKEGDSI